MKIANCELVFFPLVYLKKSSTEFQSLWNDLLTVPMGWTQGHFIFQDMMDGGRHRRIMAEETVCGVVVQLVSRSQGKTLPGVRLTGHWLSAKSGKCALCIWLPVVRNLAI